MRGDLFPSVASAANPQKKNERGEKRLKGKTDAFLETRGDGVDWTIQKIGSRPMLIMCEKKKVGDGGGGPVSRRRKIVSKDRQQFFSKKTN